MSRSFQAVCVGVITVDALALVDRYPGFDERVIGEDVMIAGGGPAANAAVVLARQGINVAFIGRVGDDQTGEQAVRLLEMEGVDVRGVLVDPASRTQTSCVVVAKETQSRAISTLAIPPLPALECFGKEAVELVQNSQWVHTDHLGFTPVVNYLKNIKEDKRPKLAVDAGNPIVNLDLSMLDLYVPTTESMTRLFGLAHTPENIEVAAHKAMLQGASTVVATSGSKGSYAWWNIHASRDGQTGRIQVPAVENVPIMSTLGAGDVFHGALLSAICRQCDWHEALLQANATAALSCRALDGRSAVPDLNELMQFLKNL